MSELRSEEGVTELRDLVAQTLEKNGALAKIKAELRASVFLALEEQESMENKAPLLNQPLKDFLSTSEGELVSCLVREFLEYFHLDFTLSVFDQETYHDKEYHYMGREKLCHDLKIRKSDSNGPVLADVLQLASKEDYRKGDVNYGDDDSASIDEMHNSHSGNGLRTKNGTVFETDSMKGMETIKVTVQPKAKQTEEKRNASDSSPKVMSEIKKDKDLKDNAAIINDCKAESPKSNLESEAITSPVPDLGELKTTFDMDSLGVYDEDFQSYASGNDVNEDNVQAKEILSPPAVSEAEEIEEDIPSAVDEPLSSSVSGGEDTTLDATISNPVGVADYMEEL